MKTLRYDLWEADKKLRRSIHAQEQMKKLGITYQHATPQSMTDSWTFWNCEGYPDPLPSYLEAVEKDPIQSIGFGLSKEDAEKISRGRK